MTMVRTLNHEFFKTWTPEMAYVLGYFAADGSLNTGHGGSYIEFKSVDRKMIENVREAIGSSHRISQYERGGNCKTCYRLQISSRVWARDLQGFGFTPKKSKTMRFPLVPAEYIGHFVRGYFDGDGCVYSQMLKYADRDHKRWILLTLFTSGSKVFLEQLWSILKDHGIRGGSLVPKKRGFELKFSHRDSLALYQLMYHTAPISDLYLLRKRAKLEQAIQVLDLLRA
ncbi:MAG TPA: LAGLIDADG family homing endonuclease [Candidatus Paceibacterota bacterium]|nr:LAGLIDADG family homing endonuclease [Candidatus Paceibacterota bacterium]